MKVIFVGIKNGGYTLHGKFSIGKVYNLKFIPNGDNYGTTIIDDDGYIRFYQPIKDYFISIEDHREKQLEELGIS